MTQRTLGARPDSPICDGSRRCRSVVETMCSNFVDNSIVETVGNNVFLGLWTAQSIPNFSQGQYMGVYAALGVIQAMLAFIMSFAFSSVAFYTGSSYKLTVDVQTDQLGCGIGDVQRRVEGCGIFSHLLL